MLETNKGDDKLKFRKKPVEIEAMEFTNETKDQVYNFVTCNKSASFEGGTSHPTLKIQTLEGVMTAHVGDWIIKGVNGEFYPCKPDIFDMTYDKVLGEFVGCKDPERTQDDGDCYCNECSMGGDPDECKSFREENKLILM